MNGFYMGAVEKLLKYPLMGRVYGVTLLIQSFCKLPSMLVGLRQRYIRNS